MAMKPDGKQIIGMLAAAAMLCGTIMIPGAATATELSGPSAAESAIAGTDGANPSSAQGSQAQQADMSKAQDAINASSDTEEDIAKDASADTGTDASTDASKKTDKDTASVDAKPDTSPQRADADTGSNTPRRKGSTMNTSVDTSSLTTLLDSTKEGDLKPLASGYRSDDSGTAPYDSVQPNSKDLTALHAARDAAQAVIDNAAATDKEVSQASQTLQQAFDAVRFIYHYTGITGTNGARLYDNNGNLIQAHGAGIQRVKASLLAAKDRNLDENGDGFVYIWCGEDKTDRLVAHGVRIYYSDDLYNWTDEGLGFQTYLGDSDLNDKRNGADAVYQQYYNTANIASDPDYTNIYGTDFSTFANDSSNYNIASAQDALNLLLWDLKALKGAGDDATKTSCVFERPKMAYNATTNRWVIWFHADGPKYGNENTATYSKAKAGVAISTTADPAGPYKYLGSFRMSPGRNSGNPGMARDMNLYIDEGKDLNKDGVDDAYLIYASNENRDLTISLLDSTYTKLVKPVAQQRKGTDVASGDTYNIAATNSKESPAPFKWKGKYYIIYSETTGWAPNENKYTISESDNILGPYHEAGTPFVEGSGPNQSPSNSFTTQSSSVIPYDADKGLFIYWGDRWFNPDTGNDISQSRYVMTPMQLVDGKLKVLPAGDWKLEDLAQYESIDVLTKLPSETGSIRDLMAGLPTELEVQRGGESKTTTTPVSWDTYFGAEQPSGEVTITGKLPKLNNIAVSFTVTVYPKNTYLYIDAGSDPNNESDYFAKLRRASPAVAKQEHSDQIYTTTNGWGFSGSLGADGDAQKYGTDGNDVYETGLYANTGQSIVYKADLAPGVYTVQAGMKDWWAQWNDRTVNFTVSDDAVPSGAGELGSASVNLKNGQKSTSAITFTLKSKTTVSFTASSNGSGALDPVLSWINVSKADEDDIQSVESLNDTVAFLQGQTVGLPKTVTVTKADGGTERKPVAWQFDASALTLYAPTVVRGVVEGTTLPATATVQMIQSGLSYFIDVNGGDSATYGAAAKLTEAGLSNAKADQVFDEQSGWGNASSNYGSQSAGEPDPFESGIYAGADGNAGSLSYKLTLTPGKHRISLGMHDWWNQTRPTVISYQYDGMAKASDLANISVDKGRNIASGTISIPEGGSKVITLTLASTQGTGPVLSWISAADANSPVPPVTPGGDGDDPGSGDPGSGDPGSGDTTDRTEPNDNAEGGSNKPIVTTGAAILGVGALAVLLAGAGAMFMIWRRRRKI